ncbi:uncharacterized protein PADG_04427 [Paracoccidioides brasiliensis Pb18]|uniref:Cyclic nucleotide-binding domain-containing protein n=1 Tax=Paracoccidioides brasiliensis (strain Pb18) TaxID=502780 RepID=C1GAZ1_PARBD|nr:uncharacterized protein PADG_04427 [Paracoccidioides brasiliensis Pb18]EEH48343.1 hypothetical protein PADG_04427 [Paracoccidioides brasiliensis Pb18]
MRRHSRGSSGGPAVVNKSAAPGSDPMSLIRTFNSETNPSRPVRPSPLAASQIQGMPLDLIDRIRSFPLFQSTPESFLAEIGLHLRPQLNSTNDYILTEGDEAKAMYWLVRGAVAVTSRDGESVYAELKPGAFFGEIGVLMDRPRTATIIARTRCLLIVLTKEDFKKILPAFPEVEQMIREEAEERLLILERKKKEPQAQIDAAGAHKRVTKRVRDAFAGSSNFDDDDGPGGNSINKKRKSPSPGVTQHSTSSALANGLVNVRLLLKELPLFAGLPSNILHFLGLNAQPRTYPPFTDIIRQDSQGREIYFIVRGEVEVLNERGLRRGTEAEGRREVQVKARLKAGQYFGEVVSLSLAPRRTATVRSVTSVECLMISGEVLSEFWDRCPKHIREQVENTARKRLVTSTNGEVEMDDAPADQEPPMDELVINGNFHGSARRQSMPLLTLTETELDSPHKPSLIEDRPTMEPSDPDPFLSISMDNVRARSRRGSLVPIDPDGSSPDQQLQSPLRPRSGTATPSKLASSEYPSSVVSPKQSTPSSYATKNSSRCCLNDDILLVIFQQLELHHLLPLRAVSRHWADILTTSPLLLHFLDLSSYNRKLTDDVLANIICPFVGDRPRTIDMNNCFHITDEGFRALANTCGANLRALKMKSVWDVTAPAILDIANKAKSLQEIDLSNCRKVSDTLLARIVGWTVPNPSFGQHYINGKAIQAAKWNGKPFLQNGVQTASSSSAGGTVVGCPALKRLALSYCKHVTDRSMHHIASYAASRLEEVDLTRCTTITDQGFQYWGNAQFVRLRKLCLADCTYLTDSAIVSLTNAAKGLQELDLSFCCALSDTATEVLALGCPQLTHLNLSFCGSAVSDPSLRCIGLHLILLRELSVRGCVRVTGTGVESVVDGCSLLRAFDVSQCKNLAPWLEYGFHRRYGDKIRFETVSCGGRLVR